MLHFLYTFAFVYFEIKYVRVHTPPPQSLCFGFPGVCGAGVNHHQPCMQHASKPNQASGAGHQTIRADGLVRAIRDRGEEVERDSEQVGNDPDARLWNRIGPQAAHSREVDANSGLEKHEADELLYESKRGLSEPCATSSTRRAHQQLEDANGAHRNSYRRDRTGGDPPISDGIFQASIHAGIRKSR